MILIYIRLTLWSYSYNTGGGGWDPPTDPNPGGGDDDDDDGGGGGGYSPDPEPEPEPDEPEDPLTVVEQKLTDFLDDFIYKIDLLSRNILSDILNRTNAVIAIGDLGGILTLPGVAWFLENGTISFNVLFPSDFVAKVTNEGMNHAVCHEMWHLYENQKATSTGEINDINDHSSLLSHPLYDSWLRAIIPNKSDTYYEILKYAGAENAPEYENLPQSTKNAIAAWLKNNYF